MIDNVRIKLLFSQKFNCFLYYKSNKFWTSVNKKTKFEDFKNHIIENFLNSRIQNIILSLEDCIFPPWESCDILRENDLIYVDIDDQQIHNDATSVNTTFNTNQELQLENVSIMESSPLKKKRKKTKHNDEESLNIEKNLKHNSQNSKKCSSENFTNDDIAIPDLHDSKKKSKKHKHTDELLSPLPDMLPKYPKNSEKKILSSTEADGTLNLNVSESKSISHLIDETKSKRQRRKRHKKLKNDNSMDLAEAEKKTKWHLQPVSNKTSNIFTQIFSDNKILNSNCYTGKHFIFNAEDNSNSVKNLHTQNYEYPCKYTASLKSYTNLNSETVSNQLNVDPRPQGNGAAEMAGNWLPTKIYDAEISNNSCELSIASQPVDANNIGMFESIIKENTNNCEYNSLNKNIADIQGSPGIDDVSNKYNISDDDQSQNQIIDVNKVYNRNVNQYSDNKKLKMDKRNDKTMCQNKSWKKQKDYVTNSFETFKVFKRENRQEDIVIQEQNLTVGQQIMKDSLSSQCEEQNKIHEDDDASCIMPNEKIKNINSNNCLANENESNSSNINCPRADNDNNAKVSISKLGDSFTASRTIAKDDDDIQPNDNRGDNDNMRDRDDNSDITNYRNNVGDKARLNSEEKAHDNGTIEEEVNGENTNAQLDKSFIQPIHHMQTRDAYIQEKDSYEVSDNTRVDTNNKLKGTDNDNIIKVNNNNNELKGNDNGNTKINNDDTVTKVNDSNAISVNDNIGIVNDNRKVNDNKANVVSNDNIGTVNAESEKNEGLKNYVKFPVLTEPPSIGSLIAFKMLEIGLNYCPHVSEYKEAKVLDFLPEYKEIKLEIIWVNKPTGEVSDKFEVTVEDENTILTNNNRIKENQKVCLCWTSLIEPRLLKSID